MQTIREHSVLSPLFCEYFSVTDHKEAILSCYTYAADVNDKGVILYSFVSDAIVWLSNDEYGILSDMDFGNGKNAALFKELRDNGYFVKKGTDELAIQEKHRKQMGDAQTNTLKVVILPTTACNANCRYCIGENNQKQSMSVATAHKVAEYIAGASKDYNSIRLDWYGGEPLLKKDLITLICKELKERVPDKKYSSVITSNLSLLEDRDFEETVKIWNIQKINITIDGTEKEHNYRKSYSQKGFNGYLHTLKCIRTFLSHGIRVFCRFNIDRDNIDQLTNVVAAIKEFSNDELFYFFVSPLRGDDCHDEFFSVDEYESVFYRSGTALNELGIHNAVDSFVPKAMQGFCLAKNKNCFVIGPSGNLYRCNLDDLSDSNSVGTVFEGAKRNAIYEVYMNLGLDTECKTCRFLPICQGGCPVQDKYKSSSNTKCDKFKFKIKAISRLLVQYYI